MGYNALVAQFIAPQTVGEASRVTVDQVTAVCGDVPDTAKAAEENVPHVHDCGHCSSSFLPELPDVRRAVWSSLEPRKALSARP